jgi:hypothetical protein
MNKEWIKRTLLAVGIAVLVSMMLAPRGKSGNSYMPFFIHSWPYYVSEYTTKEHRRRVASAFDRSLPSCSPNGWFDTTNGCLETDPTRDESNPYMRFVPRHVSYGEIVVHPAHWGWMTVYPVALDKLTMQTMFLALLAAVLVNLRRTKGAKP